jgi:hypothetical protein
VTHFRWDRETQDFVEYDPHTERAARCSQPWGPMIVRDTPAYKSPLGDGKMVDGRAARREHLKQTGCREVDPSEFKVEYWNPKFAAKHGKKHTPREASAYKKPEIDIDWKD